MPCGSTQPASQSNPYSLPSRTFSAVSPITSGQNTLLLFLAVRSNRQPPFPPPVIRGRPVTRWRLSISSLLCISSCWVRFDFYQPYALTTSVVTPTAGSAPLVEMFPPSLSHVLRLQMYCE